MFFKAAFAGGPGLADIVRQLTKEGMNAFRDYIEARRRGEDRGPVPSYLLYSSPYSESLQQQIEIEKERFYTKYEEAVYFSDVFKGFDHEEISYNGGLWSWLSLYYLDELLQSQSGRRGTLNAPNNYILEVEEGELNWRDYVKHLLATPFYIYRYHGEKSRMLLTGPVGSRKQLTFQIAGRQQFARSDEFIKLVNRLYEDDSGNTKSGVTSGISSKFKANPGDLSRLFLLFKQLELTYDIFNMSCEKMIELLPSEFDEWLA